MVGLSLRLVCAAFAPMLVAAFVATASAAPAGNPSHIPVSPVAAPDDGASARMPEAGVQLAACRAGWVPTTTGGCMPAGNVDCHNGYNCPGGSRCVEGGKCLRYEPSRVPGTQYPPSGAQCGNGRGSCPAGLVCSAYGFCIRPPRAY
jgi:hypothetical protein